MRLAVGIAVISIAYPVRIRFETAIEHYIGAGCIAGKILRPYQAGNIHLRNRWREYISRFGWRQIIAACRQAGQCVIAVLVRQDGVPVLVYQRHSSQG